MMLQAGIMPVTIVTEHASCKIMKVWKRLIIKHQALEQASVCLYQGRNVDCVFHVSCVTRQLREFYICNTKVR